MSVVEADTDHVRTTGLSNDTTLLLGLEGLAVQHVEIDDTATTVVHLGTSHPDAARCPSCAQLSSQPKQRVTTQPRDLPHGGRGGKLLWHKKRGRGTKPASAPAAFPRAGPAP